VRGRGNKLPVLCIPGFCSSGLEVKQSDFMPSWVDTRVWFSLQKLSRARTQASGAKGDSAAQSISIKVQKAFDLSLDATDDRESIDGLVVKLCLLSKSGEKLAESTTDPIRLAVDEVWSGVANYNQSVLLASESQTAAAALHVSLIDEDTAEFAEDDDDEEFVEENFGETTLQLKDLKKGKTMRHTLTRKALGKGSAGTVILEAGPLQRASKKEHREEEHAMAQAQSKMKRLGQQNDGARAGHAEDEDEAIPKAWMQHMLLAEDGHSDPNGIKVRGVAGLAGCNYLQPGVMAAATWVFGHVTKHLKRLGYGPHNLKAATYDWRQPPMFLEEQSGYFTNMIRTVEKMYKVRTLRSERGWLVADQISVLSQVLSCLVLSSLTWRFELFVFENANVCGGIADRRRRMGTVQSCCSGTRWAVRWGTTFQTG
jgi:hypothetical protein